MQLSKQFADVTFKGESKIERFSSPVDSYNILNSPEQKITMVESQIKNISDTPGGSIIKDNKTSADRSKVSNSGFSASYRSASQSESITSSIREGFTSTAKYGITSLTDSSKLGGQNVQSGVYNSGYNMTTSQQGGLTNQYQGTYQTSGLNRYEPTTYQSSTGSLQSGSYQASTTPYQTILGGSSSFQAGTYQPGTYQTSSTSSFQSSSYQPQGAYQPYQPSSGLYGSSTFKSGTTQLPKPSDKK